MNLTDFQILREQRQREEASFRQLCFTCLQPGFSCYCQHIQRFDPQIKFVILIHPIEMRRRIATGRMSYLTLQNSHLIMGQDYSHNSEVNALLKNPEFHPVVLYPGLRSTNLSHLSCEAERQSLFPTDKKLLLFVIDGTWATAKKTMYQSANLQNLPRICFSPAKPSTFRVRKQPAPGCYSTIEAIHQTIDLLGDRPGFKVASREHDKLLHVFDAMVERQLEFKEKSEMGPQTYRRIQRRPPDPVP